MDKYFVVALVLVCVFVISVGAQGRPRSSGAWRGRGRGFRRIQGDADSTAGNNGRPRRPNWRKSRWMSLKNTWSVALPGGGLAEEVAFLRTASGDSSFRAMQNIMWMMSRSDSLQAANFQKAFTMVDFNTELDAKQRQSYPPLEPPPPLHWNKEAGIFVVVWRRAPVGLLGIRVELPDELTEPDTNDWRQKRRYWRNKKHACFISDVEYNILDASAELNARNSSETAVALGTEKVMYAQFVNAMSVDDIAGTPIGRLCGRAANDNKAFRLVSTDDGLQYSSDTYTVLGHIDVEQPGKSVPMKIFVDAAIDLNDSSDPQPQ